MIVFDWARKPQERVPGADRRGDRRPARRDAPRQRRRHHPPQPIRTSVVTDEPPDPADRPRPRCRRDGDRCRPTVADPASRRRRPTHRRPPSRPARDAGHASRRADRSSGCDDVSVLLRHVPGRQGHHVRRPDQRDHRAHRAVGQRQVHAAARDQPDERPDPGHPPRAARSSTTARTSTRPSVDPVEVRRRIGMVFQKPNPFPKSIYDNVAFGPRVTGFKGNMDELVEQQPPPGGDLGRGQGQAQAVRHWRCRAASSSACASPARSPSSPR